MLNNDTSLVNYQDLPSQEASNLNIIPAMQMQNDPRNLEIEEQITNLNTRPSFAEVIQGDTFALARNVDNSYSLKHNYMSKLYQKGIKEMPYVKVTKRKTETVKVDKIIEFLRPR